VVFLVVLFLLKTGWLAKNKTTGSSGLTYSNITIKDLANKSTTGDGIPDWEKILWGLDPTKKENVLGVPDSVTIEKLKAAQGTGNQTNQADSSLTKTEQFSRDLFATVAAASQDGQPLDQATIDKISSSLADQIQNSSPRKVFAFSDLKIIKDDSVKAVQKYSDLLNSIFSKTPIKYTVIDVLQKFTADGNNPDVSVLPQLDPIIKQTNGFISGMTKMEVPQSLASLHLNVINGLEKMVENLNDIKLYDTDAIVALGAISQYETNATALESATQNLAIAIQQKLKK
jgi:hypothetical protein